MATGTSLSMTSSPREKLIEELRDHAYRRAFVEAHAGDSIAFQLKTMRLERGMEQRDVATLLGNPKLQPMISRYENPDYGKYSVKTLLELADAFDVALMVHFAPFSELVDWDLSASSEKLNPISFDGDEGLWGEGATSTASMMYKLDSSHTEELESEPEVERVEVAADQTQEEVLDTQATELEAA
jgi:transcriptional regulator with XRE-family HTH domain